MPLWKKIAIVAVILLVVWIFVDPPGAAAFVKTIFGGLWTGAQQLIKFLKSF